MYTLADGTKLYAYSPSPKDFEQYAELFCKRYHAKLEKIDYAKVNPEFLYTRTMNNEPVTQLGQIPCSSYQIETDDEYLIDKWTIIQSYPCQSVEDGGLSVADIVLPDYYICDQACLMINSGIQAGYIPYVAVPCKYVRTVKR